MAIVTVLHPYLVPVQKSTPLLTINNRLRMRMSLTNPPLQPLHPQVLVEHMMGVLSPIPVTLALPLLQRMVTTAPTLVQPHRPPPDGERLPGDAELDGKPPVATHTQRSQDANRTARLYGLLVTHGEEYERLTNKKKDNFWMNDVLIDLFLCLLQIRLRSDNVFVMDTAFLPHRMKQCISPSSFQRKATLLDKEYFLIPCNVGKSHWILCFVIWNEIKPMVWVFDSMNSGGGETTSATAGVKTCLGAIDNFFEERFQQEKGHRREGTKGKQLLQISRGNLGFGNVAITCAISRTCCCMPLPSTTLEAERHGFTKKCPDRNMCDL